MNATKSEHFHSDRDLSITMGVFCGLFELWALLRAFSWTKRSGKQPVDPITIAKFLVTSCGMIANAFLLVVIGASFHWFIVYKRHAIRTLAAEYEHSFTTYLYVAFVLKFVNLICDLVVLSNIDIFFIDWERPKVRSQKASLKERTPANSSVSEKETETTASEPQANREERETVVRLQQKLISDFPVISIWRTYFVANEWVKLSAYRKLTLSIHLFLVLLLLNTFGLEHHSTLAEASDNETQKHIYTSSGCRIAIASFSFIILATLQIIFKKFFYMKIIKDKLHEFVDLCSVSNVSLFCFISKKFGYYIHGRSPNGHSDISMKEMHEFLKREEEDLCPKRGLLPNTDQQTFEMALPTSVHEQYKRIRTVLTSYSQATDRMQGIGGSLFKVDIEKVIPTYHTINKFLSGFIEHAYKDVDYAVKDKSNIEMILDTEFVEPGDKGIFYNDNGHSFEAVLLCGLEQVDQNYSSSFYDYFPSQQVITHVYLNASRRNLVRKALVDERFLM
ncbi:meckelin-like protein [Dinothrombium tinctorium]|uniref:Meckelin-like protein n=1 Tax=Dinothrombium tinctorium TaxID=1965070 RepID=A0A3S3PHU4_9ACAR|nr:meckelin-like protein [Dinothrombium tinctorium]